LQSTNLKRTTEECWNFRWSSQRRCCTVHFRDHCQTWKTCEKVLQQRSTDFEKHEV